MGSTILVRDALWQASDQLHDLVPAQFTRWSQKTLVNALNNAQWAIAKFLPSSCARVDSIKLVPGTKQSIKLIDDASIKPGDGSAAVTVRGRYLQRLVRNMGANGTTPGRAIRLVDHESLDSGDINWHASTGSVVLEYTFDPRTPWLFYIAPGVSADPAVWVEASYLADPTHLDADVDFSADDSTLSISDVNFDDVLHYMLAYAHLRDSDDDGSASLASTFTNLFNASINAQALKETGVNPNLKSLPMNPTAPARKAA